MTLTARGREARVDAADTVGRAMQLLAVRADRSCVTWATPPVYQLRAEATLIGPRTESSQDDGKAIWSLASSRSSPAAGARIRSRARSPDASRRSTSLPWSTLAAAAGRRERKATSPSLSSDFACRDRRGGQGARWNKLLAVKRDDLSAAGRAGRAAPSGESDERLTAVLIDTHAHLDDEQFASDLPAVLDARLGRRRVEQHRGRRDHGGTRALACVALA